MLAPLVLKLTTLAERAGCEVNIDISRFPDDLDLVSGNNAAAIKNVFLAERYFI